LNILRIYPFIPPLVGGMEKHILRLSQEQRRLGHKVSIAYNQGTATSSDDIHISSRIKLKGLRPQAIRDGIFYLKLIVYILRNKPQFDVVHIHGAWSSFLFGFVLKKTCHANVLVASVHGQLKNNRAWRFIHKIVLSKFDFIYCTGNRDVDYLNIITDTRVYWRSSGFDECFLPNNNNAIKDIDVVNIGSFVHVKNHALMLEIADSLPNLTFAFIGTGPLLEKTKSLANKKNITNIKFLGQLNYKEVADILKRSKIFLMTSFTEGTPTAFLEAMATGNVLVTSNSNDFNQIIDDNRTGYIINDFNPDSYSKVISELLADEKKLHLMSKDNIYKARDYSWPKVAKDITDWMTFENR
jgi:glycosyltransferase involved in cell wall biosynthesis